MLLVGSVQRNILGLNGGEREEGLRGTGMEEREIQFGGLNTQLITGITKRICGQKATIKVNVMEISCHTSLSQYSRDSTPVMLNSKF